MTDNEKFLNERKALLTDYSAAYYKGEPEVPDAEFDRLLAEYVEAGGEEVVGHGYNVQGSRKVEHTVPMQSLDKVREKSTVLAWVNKCKNAHHDSGSTEPLMFNVSPKFDGLAIAVTLKDDKVTLVATRGGGGIGEDVTRTAMNVPTIVSLAGDGVVTGEILLPKENLDRVNELRDPKDEKVTQLRNAASGIIRKLNDKNKIASQLVFANHNDGPWVKEYTADEFVEQLDDILAHYEPLRTAFPVAENQHVPIDGVVFKVSNPEVRDVMGAGSKSPRWAVAYKYEDEIYESVVTGVQWRNPGKIGRITPVITYAPIAIDGGNYTQATAHNLTRYQAFAPNVGDKIYMKKSGDVIPYVVQIDKLTDGSIDYPRTCPLCGTATVVDGEFLVCPAPRDECDPVQGITFIINALGIKGIQIKLIDRIYDQTTIKDETDLHDALVALKNLPEGTIANLPGVGQKTEDFVKQSLNEAWETAPLASWIYGLNIERVGSTVSTTLEETYGTLEGIIKAIDDPSAYKEVTHLKGVNWNAIQNAREQFVRLKDWAEANDVKMPTVQATIVDNDTWSGKKVVITGSLPIQRSVAEAWLKQNGAIVQSGFSGSTDILIDAGDGTSSKSVKARKLNKEVMLGDAFMNDHYNKG